MSIRPVSASARLEGIKGIRVLSYSDLLRADDQFPVPGFVRAFRDDFHNNAGKWNNLISRLADDESRAVLDSVIRFRLTADHRFMSKFSVRFEEQYFDSTIAFSDSEVFVDCGGFDGDTVAVFCSRVAQYKRIYMFEPSEINFNKAKTRLAGVRDLVLVPHAVSDVRESLRFDASAGSASSVAAAGGVIVEAVALDEYITEPVTYIKMDLEGWELRALKGAERHIFDGHPKMAISVYHRASDFWAIPELVLALRNDYYIYLRHYSEGWSETVMYFVPHA